MGLLQENGGNQRTLVKIEKVRLETVGYLCTLIPNILNINEAKTFIIFTKIIQSNSYPALLFCFYIIKTEQGVPFPPQGRFIYDKSIAGEVGL